MTKKTVEDIKNELSDSVNTLMRKRDTLVIEVGKLDKELELKLDQLYALDESKVRITCPNCRGLGYIQSEDKKIQCQACGGKQYLWVNKYNPQPTKED